MQLENSYIPELENWLKLAIPALLLPLGYQDLQDGQTKANSFCSNLL